MRALLPSRIVVFAVAVAQLLPIGARAQDTGPDNDATLRALQPPEAAEPTAPVAKVSDEAPAAKNLMAIEFVDRVYFKEETLRTFVLHPVPGPLDVPMLHADAARIEAQFKDRGFLTASVAVQVVPLPLGGTNAVFKIHAGERAELKRVKILGQQHVSERDLKEGLFSRPPELLGVFTRAGFFHRPYLDQDAQRVVANFYKQGYLEARVLDTTVAADQSLGGLSVTMSVFEGPQYELAELRFTGDIPKDSDVKRMRDEISIKDGAVCDLVAVQTEADKLLDALRYQGHPFARFEQTVVPAPPPSKNDQHRAVVLTLKFIAGPAPLVRDVRVVGNKGTRESVIRRDVVVQQGKPYDHAATKESERLLMRSGFFQSASVRAVMGPTPDIADVEVTVVEAQTWLLSIAPAYDATRGGEGFILVGLAGDRNLLGFGLSGMFIARLSGQRQTFDASLTEPRLLDTHIVLTAELHRREISFGTYRTRSEVGGGLRAAFPILETGLYFGAAAGLEYGGVVLYSKKNGDAFNGPKLPLNDKDHRGLFPAGVLRNVVRASATFDKRDNVLSPRNGIYADVNAGYAGPLTLSGLAFLDTGASFKAYWSPLFDITLKTNTDVGFVFDPHGDDVPVTDRFFGGGLGSVRGYAPLSLGPVRRLDLRGRDALVEVGGVVRAAQNLEIEFPLWPNVPLRGFVFFDAGNAFGEGELQRALRGEDLHRGATLPLGLFMSTGFGVLIATPLLPFRFEWSVPLTRRANDQAINFFLGVGSAF